VGYTRRQAILAALVANAIKPVRGPITVVPVFFASWLTSELAPHILVAARSDLANFQPAVLDHYTLWNADQLYFTPQLAGQRR